MTNSIFESSTLKTKLFACRQWLGFIPDHFSMFSVALTSLLMKVDVTGIAVSARGIEITLKIQSLLELKVLLLPF